MDKEAVVHASLTGADEVARGAEKIKSAWSGAGEGIGKTFKAAGSAVAEAAGSMLSDIGHVVTAAGAISFAGSLAEVHAFEEATARMGVGAKRSIQDVQDGIDELAKDLNELPNATVNWVSSVGKLTYSYERAAQAAKGAQEFAAFTGQTVQEVAPLSVAILNAAGAGSDLGKILGVLTKQAQDLGTVGGPKALADMFTHLQGQVSGLSGKDGLAKTTALMAGFGGKEGFTPQQRERAFSSVIGKVEGDPMGFERFLGHKITDEYGHVENMAGVMKELAAFAKKGKGQQLRSDFTFGKEATSALMHTDFDAINNAAYASPSSDPAHALERLKDSPAGKRAADDIEKKIAMQKDLGHGSWLGGAYDTVNHWAAKSPILTGLGLGLGGNMLSSLPSKIMKKVLGQGLKAAAGEAAGGAVESASTGLGLGLGASGMAAGGVLLAGALATGQTLSELGAASAAKQGFMNKPLYYGEAEDIAASAAQTEQSASGHRSSGMNAAMAAEKARLSGHGQAAVSADVAADGQYKAMVATLTKAGATLSLAQQTAAGLLLKQQTPIKIEVIDSTSLGVNAQVRGEQ